MQQLRAAGITQDRLKALFTAKVPDKEIQNLTELIRNRIREGRLRNFSDFRQYAAIDLCYDAAFHQTTPALMRHVCDTLRKKDLKPDEALLAVKEWGLGEDQLFTCTTCADGSIKKILNEPTFYNVLVPILKAFITIRLAKLFNERNQSPLLRYEPREYTDSERVKAEAVTDLVSKITDDFGYGDTLKAMIFNALMYSVGIAFPTETWYVDSQLDDDGNEIIVKEGIRYVVPHPTRMAYDLNYPINSINSDSGVEWAFMWRLIRYSDIASSPLYWNKDKIPVGTAWWDREMSGNFFAEIYPCRIQFPNELYMAATRQDTSREFNAGLYTLQWGDKAVFVNNMFMKLIPNQHGLGDYKYPIWFRFEVASDATIIWAEAVPYTPLWYMGYDADQNRSKNASMALEIVPFQEVIGNVLTQILLTVKQNLVNIIQYDKEQISGDDITKITNSGERLLRGLTFLPFSSTEARRINQSPPSQAFVPHKFPYTSTQESFQTINTVIMLMERLLGMSPQEVGQGGSHEQSATEMREIAINTSVRVEFTGSGVDAGVFAWKRQLWDACQQFLDEDFVAQVSSDVPDLEAVLTTLGFEIVENSKQSDGKVKISGKKRKLVMDSIISTRDGPRRIDSQKIGMVTMQAVQAVAANPMLAQAVGAEPLLKLLNAAAKLMGAGNDFKLVPDRAAIELVKKQHELQFKTLQEQQTQLEHAGEMQKKQATAAEPQQVIAAVKQMIDQALADVAPKIVQASELAAEKNIGEPTAQALKHQQESLIQIQQQLQQMSQVVQKLEQIAVTATQAPPLSLPTANDSHPEMYQQQPGVPL